MIAELTGTVSHIDGNTIILSVNGIGYKITASTETVEAVRSRGNASVTLSTYLAVREDALDLYGFLDRESKSFFELLITVSGIGPKSALAIMNLASISLLRRAISKGDPSHLSKVTGIGAKKAEKIVLELKDKLVLGDDEKDEGYRDETDALEALKALGYNERDAREALKKISKEHTEPKDRIKHALKVLGK